MLLDTRTAFCTELSFIFSHKTLIFQTDNTQCFSVKEGTANIQLVLNRGKEEEATLKELH